MQLNFTCLFCSLALCWVDLLAVVCVCMWCVHVMCVCEVCSVWVRVVCVRGAWVLCVWICVMSECVGVCMWCMCDVCECVVCAWVCVCGWGPWSFLMTDFNDSVLSLSVQTFLFIILSWWIYMSNNIHFLQFITREWLHLVLRPLYLCCIGWNECIFHFDSFLLFLVQLKFHWLFSL